LVRECARGKKWSRRKIQHTCSDSSNKNALGSDHHQHHFEIGDCIHGVGDVRWQNDRLARFDTRGGAADQDLGFAV